MAARLSPETTPLDSRVHYLIRETKTSVSSLRAEMEIYDAGNYIRSTNTTCFMQLADESLAALEIKFATWMRKWIKDRREGFKYAV